MQTYSSRRSTPPAAPHAKRSAHAAAGPLQQALNGAGSVQTQLRLDRTLNRGTENRTGMPDHIKSGIENLSGMSLDDVRVHYNSTTPAQLHAHAYTRENDIHLAAGQSRHLAHEAWHVVQQRQGRVDPTLRMRGVDINDDPGLEREADVMGQRAAASNINTEEGGEP